MSGRAQLDLEREAQAAALLRQELVNANLIEHDDDALWHDTVEGETSLPELIDGVYEAMAQDEADAAYCNQRIAQMDARKARLENRVKRVKAMIRAALDSAGLKGMRRPYATFSVSPGKSSLEVTDAEAIPKEYRVVSWKPDNAKIKADLEAGLEVPGAQLRDGRPSLRVTTT